MDVHNCFYLLMLKAFELSNSIEEEELKRFSIIVKNGKFYEMFVDELLRISLLAYMIIKRYVKRSRNACKAIGIFIMREC